MLLQNSMENLPDLQEESSNVSGSQTTQPTCPVPHVHEEKQPQTCLLLILHYLLGRGVIDTDILPSKRPVVRSHVNFFLGKIEQSHPGLVQGFGSSAVYLEG